MEFRIASTNMSPDRAKYLTYQITDNLDEADKAYANEILKEWKSNG